MGNLFLHPELILEDPRVLVNGHFVGTEGEHLRFYFNKRAIPMPPSRLTGVVHAISDYYFRKDDFDTVAGPMSGAVVPAFELARNLEFYRPHLPVEYVQVDKGPQGFQVDPTYLHAVRGKSILLFEDVIQSGGSFIKAAHALTRAGGNVVYGACLCNRTGKTAEDLGVREFFSAMSPKLESWIAEECPLCKEGMPINTDLGHGAGYVLKFGQPQAT